MSSEVPPWSNEAWKARLHNMNNEDLLDDIQREIREVIDPIVDAIADRLEGKSFWIAEEAATAARDAIEDYLKEEEDVE